MKHEHHEMKKMESMNGHHHDEPVEDAEIKSWKRIEKQKLINSQ